MQQNNTTPPTNSNTPATVPGSTTSNAGGASSTNNNNNTSTSSTTSSSNSTSTSTPSSSNNHHHHHNNNNSSNPNSGRGHRYSNQNHVYQNNQSSYGYIPQGLPINAYWSQQAAVAQQAYQNGYSPYPYGYYSQPVYATGPSGHGKYDYVQHGQQQQHHHHNNHSHNNNNNNSSNNNSSSNPPQQQSHNSNTPSITSKSFSPKNNNKVPIVNQKGETANFKNLIRQRAAAAAANSGHEQSVSPSVSASTSHPVPPKPLNVANASEITPATEDAKKTPVQQPVTLSVNAKPSLATPSTTTKPAVAATSPTPVALAPVAVAPVAPVPVALAPVVPAPVDAVAAPSAPASSAALDFKAAILAKLKNKKPALSTTDSAAAPASAPASAHVSAPAPASAPAAAPTSSPAATSPATSTPAASSLPEKPVSSKPVEKKSVDEPEQVSRKEAEPVTAEKSVAEVPPVEKTVEKEAPVAEEPVKQEAPVAEEQVKSEPSTAPVAVKADEPVTLSDSLEKESTETEQDKQEPKATEVEAAEEAQEEETPVDTYTISQFFDKIKAAKPIDNVYEFKYPEGTKLPDTKFTKDARRKYDPLFLLQFKDIVNLPVDENWTEKFGSKIVIPKSTGKDNKSDRSFSKNGGQFGKGVIGGSGAPLLGSAMRNQNVRDFNGSRSGSRSGSKRGPREKSKRDRSDRGDRQQSRRHRGGDSKEAERNPDGTIRPLDKPATVGFNNEPLPPPPTELKPLEKSAGRWVPKFQRKKEKEVKLGPDGTPILDDDDVESKVKSYLNKLTLEKFDTISNDIIQIADQSKFEEDNKSVNKVIQLTFAKACDEPHWSAMYAKFCLKLVTDISPDVFKGEVPEEFSKQNFASKLVRKNLIEICQKEYTEWSTKLESKEINLSLDMNNVELMSDEYYKVAAAKRRGLGLVRFIGELYILKLLGLAKLYHN
ncbi:unnamed protein product [[Candida] boidinii]|uniref:Unnamed protein product n=1 Tax=Candida boidinii TaxID=5477 RepID=A0A9W6SYY1_CANBO|nr:unnamed protein product [[Candida] boidinii]